MGDSYVGDNYYKMLVTEFCSRWYNGNFGLVSGAHAKNIDVGDKNFQSCHQHSKLRIKELRLSNRQQHRWCKLQMIFEVS